MASGLVVVGTLTGGTRELLKDGQTGCTFTPEDAEGLADQVVRLYTDPELCCRLSQAGRRTVLENFTLEKMVAEIEAYLFECLTEAAKL
jgi:glycosyltransferase involved in cell wall biosynthesis